MVIYSKNLMVEHKHIVEIDKQLKQFGSKVGDSFLDGDSHCLANVLNLAYGSGTYGITLDKINSIQTNEFKIDYICK
jgi:hypothetical protein